MRVCGVAPGESFAATFSGRRERLLAAAPTARDAFALSVLLDLGVRRNELRTLRVRDVDLARRALVVFGKGQKARVLPLRGPIVLAAEGYLLEELEGVGRQPATGRLRALPGEAKPRPGRLLR